MIKEFLMVGLSGAIGSILRYAVKLLCLYFNFAGFISTLSVNILGSFLIGIALSTITDKDWSLLVVVGFMGGFTTFSSFSAEAVAMLQNGEFIKGCGYIAISIIACLLMTYIGLLIGKKF